MQNKPTLILGGPGCGKTTALLDIVEKALDNGVSADRIAFVAFTRKAAQEARERMSAKFGLSDDDIQHFRTLHSFAFAHLGINRNRILDGRKLREYAKAEGLSLSEDFSDEFGLFIPRAYTDDEKALAAISLARLTMRDLVDVAIDSGLDYEMVLDLAKKYNDFKQSSHLIDFTDMISKFNGDNVPLFELLIVDEAQDLSRLQWRMVELLMQQAKQIYFAGDDDQCIYAWAGADIDYFLNIDAEKRVLPISYRLKNKIFDACRSVIALCDNRYKKDWKPHAAGGVVDYVHSLDALDLSAGTWFLLARTNSLIYEYIKYLREHGFPYFAPNRRGVASSLSVKPVQAVLIYENLRLGKKFTGDKMQLLWGYIRRRIRPEKMPSFERKNEYSLADLCSTGFSADKNWIESLTMSEAVSQYIRAMRARGESLMKTPRITVSTIHRVKGGEADNVVIKQQLTSITWRSWTDADAQEVRVLFTAMSRAKERLFFLNTESQKNYEIERILA